MEKIPSSLQWTYTDYEFPSECCRCNSKPGDSFINLRRAVASKGSYGSGGRSLIARFEIPICGECSDALDRLVKQNEKRLVRVPLRILVASVPVFLSLPIIFISLFDKRPNLGETLGPVLGLFVLGALVGIVFSIGKFINVKSGTRDKEIEKIVTFGPEGFSFANKEYQARVRKISATAGPSGLVS
jgi:hypothetical protein